MDLKEYEDWLSFLKEAIASDRIGDATEIVNDLFLNKKLIEDIDADIAKVIVERLSALSIKFNKIKKSQEAYDKNKLEGTVDEIVIQFNNLIILKKINQIISEYYNNKINRYNTAKMINQIKGIKDINYTHQRNFKIYFIDKTEYYLNPKRNPKLSDELAIAIFYIAAKNTGARNSIVEISKEISTKHHKEGFKKELYEYTNQYGLSSI